MNLMDEQTILEPHPLSHAFPLMEGRAFSDFCADIEKHGLLDPIVTYQGQVLDGRNRLRACAESGVPPVFREWEGPDPLAFVLSANLQRRHLDESQRAMVAARVATLRPGSPSANAQICALPTQEEAGEMLRVSRRSVQSARKVIDKATTELVAVVEQGDVPVSTAAQIAELPKQGQRRAMKKIKDGAKPKQALRQVLREDEVVLQLKAHNPNAEQDTAKHVDDEPFYAKYGITPDDFHVATSVGGAVGRFAELAAATDTRQAARGMMPEEPAKVCANARIAVDWLNNLIEVLECTTQKN